MENGHKTVARTLSWLIVVCAMVVFGASGCTDAISTSNVVPGDISDAIDGGIDGTPGDAGVIPSNEMDPVVFIDSPDDGGTITSDSTLVSGRATDDSGLSTVFVRVGPNTRELALSDNGFRTWSFDAPTPVGEFTIEAIAYDSDGRASNPDIVTVTGRSAAGDAAAPQVTITEPVDGSTPLQTVIVLRGTTADDIGVVSMRLTLNGEPLEARSFETSDNFGTWSRRVPLFSGQANVLRVTAEDGAGNTSSDEITVFGRSQPDGERPLISISSPAADSSINSARVTVSGSASDNLAVRGVKVRTGAEPAGGCEDRQAVEWTDYVQAASNDGYASWDADVMVNPGAQCIEARAIDVSGIAQSVIIGVNNTFQAIWSADELFFMRLDPFGIPPLVNLSLSKTGVGEIINESIQRDTVVSELDASDLLTNALNTLKSSCGTCWTGARNTPNPRGGGTQRCDGVTDFDCRRTELGCSFGNENNNCAGWSSSPEYALVRLLTMTANNADLDGTSLGPLQNLLGSVTKEFVTDLLAQALRVGVNEPIVSTQGASDALRRNLIATHPNAVFDPAEPNIPLLRVTLYDALKDLVPLSERYGPVGDHPGILDPSDPPFADIFPAATFRMILVGQSNLRYHDAIQLAAGKDYLGLVEDTNGPTFDDVVEFDFESEDRFQIVGIVDNPAIDLQFSISESPRDIPVCSGPSNTSSGDSNCVTNKYGDPYKTQYVWSLDPWNLEFILADAARSSGFGFINQYVSKAFGFSFLLNAEVFIGHAGNRRNKPPGWAEFGVSGLGAFIVPPLPPQQYLPETIMDIGEIVGHRNIGGPGGCPAPHSDYKICEGDLNVSFKLRDIPTGVSAEQLENDSRQFLQEQRAELGQRLLGDFEQNNGCIDFYYDSLNGTQTLVYADASDPIPDQGGDCPGPLSVGAGFFSDPELTDKVSTVSVSGIDDDFHEKLVLTEGLRTVYAPGADGNTYRLILDVPNPSQSTEITVAIARKVR